MVLRAASKAAAANVRLDVRVASVTVVGVVGARVVGVDCDSGAVVLPMHGAPQLPPQSICVSSPFFFLSEHVSQPFAVPSARISGPVGSALHVWYSRTNAGMRCTPSSRRSKPSQRSNIAG